MSSSLKFTGLEELRAELLALAPALRDDTRTLLDGLALNAANEIRAAYPAKTGNLRKGVTVELGKGGPFAAVAVVKNTAPHAFIYENGTQVRRSAFGNRGAMPPGNVFKPVMARARRRMDAAVKTLIESHGLVVTG